MATKTGNDYISAELTKYGIKILNKNELNNHNILIRFSIFKNHVLVIHTFPHKHSWQIWEFMQIFGGNQCRNGSEHIFSNIWFGNLKDEPGFKPIIDIKPEFELDDAYKRSAFGPKNNPYK